MGTTNGDTKKTIMRWLKILVAATVGLWIALGVLWYITYDKASTSDERNARTHDALCTFRHDVEKRLAVSKQFQTDHPNGAFGFSPAQVQKSINDQQSTIITLSDLNCTKGS